MLPVVAGTEVAMSRHVALVSLAIALAVLVVGFGTGRFTASPAAAKETITVIEHADSDTVVDVDGDKKDSRGDTLVFSNDLYDADDAKVVGTDNGSCVRTDPDKKMWECTWTNVLPDGNIVVQGPLSDDAEESTMTVTGGTGEYSGASGEAVIKTRDGGKKYEFEINLN
jgi:allene oxide cyclase